MLRPARTDTSRKPSFFSEPKLWIKASAEAHAAREIFAAFVEQTEPSHPVEIQINGEPYLAFARDLSSPDGITVSFCWEEEEGFTVTLLPLGLLLSSQAASMQIVMERNSIV